MQSRWTGWGFESRGEADGDYALVDRRADDDEAVLDLFSAGERRWVDEALATLLAG